MISQSIPQLISSIITIVGTFVSMIVLSPILTILIVLMVFVMYQVMRILGSKSAFFFGNQQRDIGKVNGYIEEMMEDLTIDEQNQVIESYDGVFVEYWKFKRSGNRILLDEIRQQDEYEN